MIGLRVSNLAIFQEKAKFPGFKTQKIYSKVSCLQNSIQTCLIQYKQNYQWKEECENFCPLYLKTMQCVQNLIITAFFFNTSYFCLFLQCKIKTIKEEKKAKYRYKTGFGYKTMGFVFSISMIKFHSLKNQPQTFFITQCIQNDRRFCIYLLF